MALLLPAKCDAGATPVITVNPHKARRVNRAWPVGASPTGQISAAPSGKIEIKMGEKARFWLGIDCGGTYLKAGFMTRKAVNMALTGNRCRRYRPCRVTPNATWTSSGNNAPPPSPACYKIPVSAANKLKAWASPRRVRGLFLLDKQDRPPGQCHALFRPSGAGDRPALAAGRDPGKTLSRHPPDPVDRSSGFTAALGER